MRLTKLIISFLIVFHGQNPLASSNILETAILNPRVNPGSFILAFGDYEDVRIDADKDGKIDYWHLKRGLLVIQIYFDKIGNINSVKYQKIHRGSVSEIFYKMSGHELKLDNAKIRPLLVMNFTEEKIICEDRLSSLKDQLKPIADFKDDVSQSALSSAMGDGCKEKLGEHYPILIETLMNSLSESDSIQSCLEGDKYEKSLDGKKDSKLIASVLRASAALQRKQINMNPDQYKPLITCETANDEGKETKYSFREGGSINIVVPKNSTDAAISEKKIQHELLHRMGVVEEKNVEEIMSSCNAIEKSSLTEIVKEGAEIRSTSQQVGTTDVASQISAKDSDAKIPTPLAKPNEGGSSGAKVTSSSSIGTETGTKTFPVVEKYQASVNAAQTQTANIPQSMTVAQTGVPSSESLSETIYSNPQKTPSGIQTAYNNSTAQSSGVFKTANNLMGAMNTQADAALVATNAAQKREIASATAALSNEVAGARVAASASNSNLGLTSRNQIKSDETVVESITLDSSAQASAKAVPNTQTRSVASVSDANVQNNGTVQRAGTQAQQVPSGTSGEVSNSSGGSVNPIPSNFGGALPSGTSGGTRRQPANVNRAGSTQTEASTTENKVHDTMVNYLSDSKNYSLNKSRLQQPAFTKKLEEQSITVLDLSGKSYGAKKGQTIFLDRETSFELMKKREISSDLQK